MKKALYIIAALLTIGVCSCTKGNGEDTDTDTSTEKAAALTGNQIRICSYNMLFEKTTPTVASQKWDNRKKVVMGIMNDYNIDIVGSQEALTWQVNTILNEDSKYAKIGLDICGQTNSLKHENDAIFYLKSRFEVVKDGQFWYSLTPDVPNTWAWDATYSRACTWGLFKEISTGIQFYVFNTHVHHPNDNPEAHVEEVKMLVSKSKEINSEGLPMFYTGDFNSTPDRSGILYIVSNGMSDSRPAATKTVGRIQTYHNFSTDRDYGWRLDYIFVNSRIKVGTYRCEDTELLTQKWGSDHHPIMIDAEIN